MLRASWARLIGASMSTPARRSAARERRREDRPSATWASRIPRKVDWVCKTRPTALEPPRSWCQNHPQDGPTAGPTARSSSRARGLALRCLGWFGRTRISKGHDRVDQSLQLLPTGHAHSQVGDGLRKESLRSHARHNRLCGLLEEPGTRVATQVVRRSPEKVAEINLTPHRAHPPTRYIRRPRPRCRFRSQRHDAAQLSGGGQPSIGWWANLGRSYIQWVQCAGSTDPGS